MGGKKNLGEKKFGENGGLGPRFENRGYWGEKRGRNKRRGGKGKNFPRRTRENQKLLKDGQTVSFADKSGTWLERDHKKKV